MLFPLDFELPSHNGSRYVPEGSSDIVVGVKAFAEEGEDDSFEDGEKGDGKEGNGVEGYSELEPNAHYWKEVTKLVVFEEWGG